ncbi:hypothetical protein SCHPADRAFT_908883 [Schizopora paradoxa]|uniref:Uncharacterized protein n=1 Tax=Schizopora paradoxa TaxID=27342 RepID=A0A0H2R8F0_9AGAM|nr:hypothetical protein SCHPADRAFT_908883 [Schizopora paradoxa]
MPPTLDLRTFAMAKAIFERSNDPESSQSGREKEGDLTISTIIGIGFGSLLFIILVIGFLVVSRRRRRKANAPMSPEDEFAKASFARWQSNMAGRPQLHPQHQQQRVGWPASARRTAAVSAYSPRTSISSLSSDEKTWVDDEADLEVERGYVRAYGVGSGSGRSRSSRINLPSALPRAHIPR